MNTANISPQFMGARSGSVKQVRGCGVRKRHMSKGERARLAATAINGSPVLADRSKLRIAKLFGISTSLLYAALRRERLRNIKRPLTQAA